MEPMYLELLKRIQALEFTAVDLNLFLDTHPGDREALERYNRVTHELNELKKEYEGRFGPLLHFGFSPSEYPWRWVEDPWPWEIEY